MILPFYPFAIVLPIKIPPRRRKCKTFGGIFRHFAGFPADPLVIVIRRVYIKQICQSDCLGSFGFIMAIFWAFVCLFFSAANDFLFKCFARKPRSHGYFVAIVGIAWLITGLCFVRSWGVDWRATVLWGVVSGLCSISGNLLMLDAMRTLDGGVCSTIYRMNLVPVALGAALHCASAE